MTMQMDRLVDVYVTEANEIVRLAYDFDALGQTTSMDVTVTAIGDDVSIQLPDPDTVISIDELGLCTRRPV